MAAVAGVPGAAGVAAGDSPAKAAPKPKINKIRPDSKFGNHKTNRGNALSS